MPKFLSSDWLELQRELLNAAATPSDVSASVQYLVSGGPEGESKYCWSIEGGEIVDVALGSIPDPDISITVSWPDAVALHRGELDASVAFMQGRLKIAAPDMSLVLRLLPLTRGADYEGVQKQLAAQTEF